MFNAMYGTHRDEHAVKPLDASFAVQLRMRVMWHAILFTYNGLDLSYCWCSAVSDKVAVYVSKDLYERAEAFIKEQGGFSSVDG